MFGITERGDAGLDLSWEHRLKLANILITKSINDDFIHTVIQHSGNVIVHVTCTGFGDTVLEPNVHSMDWTYSQVMKLIDSGFPKDHLVLRVDPIIPTLKGTQTACNVLDLFAHSGIQRVRYSFIDMYPHVVTRFEKAKVPLPFTGFTSPKPYIDYAMQKLESYRDIYSLESCTEFTEDRLGCISQRDMTILGLAVDVIPSGYQRKGCLCPADKVDLLTSKTQCAHRCLYCYWKDV